MLTLSTPIPTSLRGQVRALVKASKAWPGFLAEKGMISANAKNADLIELALRHPTLKTQIEQMLRSYTEGCRRQPEALENYAAAAPAESAAVIILTKRIEQLLTAYASRKATKPRIRVRARVSTLPATANRTATQ